MTSLIHRHRHSMRWDSVHLALAAFLFALAGLADAAERKPNVVLFLVDDMGWMDSTPYGSQYYENA